MAEEVTVLLSDVINRLSDLLHIEVELLSVDGRHLRWIVRELKSMQGFLEQIEQCSYCEREEELNVWAEKLKKTAVDAEDLIETLVIRSRRRKGILSCFYTPLNVGHELLKIRKRMADLSRERMNLITTHVNVSVETTGEASSSTTIVAPAMEKLDNILSENLVDDMELVKGVKDELGYLQNIVFNLKSRGERENVWLEEVKDICKYTSDVAGNFIARKQKCMKMEWPRKVLFHYYVGYDSAAWEFEQQMKHIRTQIGDAVRRKLAYEVGGKHMGMRDKQTAQRSTLVSILHTYWTVVELGIWAWNVWKSMDRNLKCTQRDLALISAFLSDMENAEDLNKRQQVWLSQLRLVAQNGRSLVAACPEKGYFTYLSRMKFARDINGVLKEIINISDRKSNYDIADIEGSLGSSTQEIMEINSSGSGGTGEHPTPTAFSRIVLSRGSKRKSNLSERKRNLWMH